MADVQLIQQEQYRFDVITKVIKKEISRACWHTFDYFFSTGKSIKSCCYVSVYMFRRVAFVVTKAY